MACTLRRCQGIRGCICPKGKIPVGYYGKPSEESVLASETPPVVPTAHASRAASPPKKIRDSKHASPSKVKLASTASTPAKGAGTSTSASASATTTTTTTSTSAVAATAPAAPEPAGDDGQVVIRYNHYKKQFTVAKGVVQKADIDAEYCLQFAFPNCSLHVSEVSPAAVSQSDEGVLAPADMVKEDRDGNFLGVSVTREYWVHVEEDSAEREAYDRRTQVAAAEAAKKRAAAEAAAADGIVMSGTKVESCSCIEGNPCVDRYCCKDWDNRYSVAKANGWKGFQ